ncbi:MAG: efflux RND transporter permease subunit [Microbacteriaceae bacterium]
MHLFAVFSLRNRALIALVTIAAAVFGGMAMTNLKQELVPSISFPQLAIVTAYPGASPDVVNQDVSSPVETAIQGVPGLEGTVATSSTNLSVINATFSYETDLNTAEQKINQAINRIKSRLPAGVEPRVVSFSFDDFPIVQIAVSGGEADRLAAELKANVIPDIQDIAGVREAALIGAVGQRVSIVPDIRALTAAGLTTQSITQAFAQSGVLIPAGSVTENELTYSVQAGSRLGSVDEIKSLPILGKTGVTTIGDVADVAIIDDPVTSYAMVNGEDALTIAVTKLPSANTVEVSKAVNDKLADFEAAVPGATFTVVFDQAPFIEESISSLTQEGLLGLAFAVIVILVFLFSVRSTIVTAISIPTSLLITFVGLQFAGYSLNILTLGAVTIAIGRVVDDSIVVIENIKRHLEYGEEKLAAITTAVREVAGAITASTITTVAVFVPIALVGGSTGELFRPFALTVTIALMASLVVALTIVPVLAYWFLRPSKSVREALSQGVPSARGDDEHEKETWLQRIYLPIIRWTLKFPVVTLLVALLVLGGSIAMVPLMKTNFLGSTGQNSLSVTQDVPQGASLEAQLATATRAGEIIRDVPGVDVVQVSVGSSGSSLRDAFLGAGGAISYSITTNPDFDQDVLQDEVRAALAKEFDPKTLTVAGGQGLAGASDIEIDVTAPDGATLADASDALLASLSDLDGIKQYSSNLSTTRSYIAVEVDRDKAAEAGLTEIQVSSIVNAVMLPAKVGSIIISEQSYAVYLTADDVPTTKDGLEKLLIPTLAGPVALADIATVAVTEGPASITTIKGQRSATLSVTPADDNIGTASASVQQAIDDTKLPAGATATIGGVAANQADAFSQLGIAMLAAILIVYIVMVATFGSLLQPLLLLVSVPFAATGAIALQVITGIPLGVPSLIGVLMLIGIVVTNAIVLVDLVNQYRERGKSVRDALILGGGRRLRPILMTALATIFALLPMALGITGHGGFISQPLALVVIGGLVSSTLLTLVVLPVLYYVVEAPRERRRLARQEAVAVLGASS